MPKETLVKVKPITKEYHGKSFRDIIVGERLEPNKQNNDSVVGNTYTNSNGREYTILDVYRGGPDRHKLQVAKVQFHTTHNVVEAYKSHAVKSKVQDNFARTYCKVGYLGNYKDVGGLKKEELAYLKKL